MDCLEQVQSFGRMVEGVHWDLTGGGLIIYMNCVCSLGSSYAGKVQNCSQH